MTNLLKIILIVALCAALFAAGITESCWRYNECRRFHPIWYCIED